MAWTRAAWRLEQAERERAWALVAARQLEVSVRETTAAAGRSPTRVHQVVTAADLTAVQAQLDALREAGWSAPEDPEADAERSASRSGRTRPDRLTYPVRWLLAGQGGHHRGFLSAGRITTVLLVPADLVPGRSYEGQIEADEESLRSPSRTAPPSGVRSASGSARPGWISAARDGPRHREPAGCGHDPREREMTGGRRRGRFAVRAKQPEALPPVTAAGSTRRRPSTRVASRRTG